MEVSDRSGDGESPSSGDGTIRAAFDWSTVEPSTAVVETVAIAADEEPTAIAPLYDAIDPGALDGLVGGTDSSPATTVAFTYIDYHVTVSGDGFVTVSTTH